MTATEAARRLGVNVTLVVKRIKLGELAATFVPVGRQSRWEIREEDLPASIERRKGGWQRGRSRAPAPECSEPSETWPADEPLPERPRFRGECEAGPRPCPWLGCRYHLALLLYLRTFRVDPRFWLGTMDETCALDVAARGPHTLEEVGEFFGVGRERIRQCQSTALAKLLEVAPAIPDEEPMPCGGKSGRGWAKTSDRALMVTPAGKPGWRRQ